MQRVLPALGLYREAAVLKEAAIARDGEAPGRPDHLLLGASSAKAQKPGVQATGVKPDRKNLWQIREPLIPRARWHDARHRANRSGRAFFAGPARAMPYRGEAPRDRQDGRFWLACATPSAPAPRAGTAPLDKRGDSLRYFGRASKLRPTRRHPRWPGPRPGPEMAAWDAPRRPSAPRAPLPSSRSGCNRKAAICANPERRAATPALLRPSTKSALRETPARLGSTRNPLRPGRILVHDRDDIDDGAAAQGIMDEMRLAPEPEVVSSRRSSAGTRAASTAARQAVRPENLALSAPSLCRTKERTPSAPIRQSPAAFSRTVPCATAIATESSPDAKPATAAPVWSLMLRSRATAVQQGALEIGAVDDKIGRAPAPLGVIERHQREGRAIPRAADSNRFRAKRERRQALDHAELSQNRAGVRRELEACPGLFENLRFFVEADPPACPRET